MSDGTHHSLEVVGGQDTTGEYVDGKHRETWLPVELETDGSVLGRTRGRGGC